MTTFTRTLHAGGFLLGALSGAAAHAAPPATYVFTVHHLELLGVPTDDRDQMYLWSNAVIGSEDPDYGDVMLPREAYTDPATNLIYVTDGNGGGVTVLRYTGPIPNQPPIPGAR